MEHKLYKLANYFSYDTMGQQYIESLDFFGNVIKKEYPSEYGASIKRDSPFLNDAIASMVFNQQYGIFFYEPASPEEAKRMIDSFERKIADLKKRYDEELFY
jgi:hypothetical protein